MRVLVTRPIEDARLTAAELARRGHEAVVAPLFEIRIAEGPEILSENAQAILATSGNGIRALLRRSKFRNVPLFAVGSHTAAAARSAGFARVTDASGDAAALAHEILCRLHPVGGSLLLVAARHASPVLETTLRSAGFDVRVCTAYEAVALSALPVAARNALASETLDAVLLFSTRSARVFATCLREAGLSHACRRLLACCISNSAALALDGTPFGDVQVAQRPDHDRLLALLPSPGLP